VVNEPSERSFDDVQELGALIMRGLPPENHIGLLYKLGSEPARCLHLECHHRLKDEAPSTEWFWVQSGLDAVNRRVVAPAVAQVAADNQLPIPYSTIYEGIYLDGPTLRYVKDKPGDGLTCATLILAIFDALGFLVLDLKTWKERDEDRKRLETLVRLLKEHSSATEEHVAVMEARPSGIRYRPEEVVGAVSEQAYPVAFDHAVLLETQVLAEMTAIEQERLRAAQPTVKEATPPTMKAETKDHAKDDSAEGGQ
jgi:hypothetical protein